MGCGNSRAHSDYGVHHPHEEIFFTQSEKVNIDRYFHHLYKRIKMGVPLEEIRHIREGVESCVRTMLDKIAEVDIRFHVERHGLIQIGSFVEGTKLKAPDEFNYIAVLSELDSDDLVLDDPNHQQNDIQVKLRVRQQKNETFRQNWKRAIVDEVFLLGKRTKKYRKNGVLDKFLRQIRKYLKTFETMKTPVGEIALEGKPSMAATIFKSSVLLKLKITRQHIVFQGIQSVEVTKSYPIYVTITPAIRWFKVGNYFFQDDVMVPFLYTEVLKSDSFLLFPGPDGHFVKSFAEVESIAIKGMSARHRKALTIIKYLMNGEDRLTEYQVGVPKRLMTSYSLKMATLCFVSSCPCSKGGDSDYEVVDCVLHLLTHIYDNLHGKPVGLPLLPNAFIKTTSTVDREVQVDEKLIYMSNVLLAELLKHDLKLWIGKLQKYDFEASIPRYGVVPLYTKLNENKLHSV